MKLQLEKALSLVAVGVIGVLGSAHAAPVYEIKNLQDYDLKGNLEGTRNGYAMGVNSANEMVGISKGRKKLSTEDVEGGLIDPDDGIADEEKITYSILSPIVANNFPFSAAANGAAGAWLPTFESVNGSTDPKDTDPSVPESINSIDAYFYGIGEDGTKVGSMTAPEKKVTYVGTITDQKYWYYRDFELRAVVKKADGTEIALPPPYVEYTSTKAGETNKKAYLGGSSSASAINGERVTGYASTGLSKFGAERAQACLDSVGTENALPLDICIQQEQYPNASGSRNIQYQTRAYVWQLGAETVTGTELPLGLTPPSDSNFTYVAQGLGINADGTVVGRSHVNRNDNGDYFRMDAAYWTRKEDGSYQYNWVPVVNVDEVQSSIAYGINDNGILVGSYRSYIGGYPRDKFFYFDTKAATPAVVVPNDFYPVASDLSSRPRDINNLDQVVGYIETTHDKEKPRPKAGFLFDKNAKEGGEFSNLNNLLTCESKGFEKAANGNWQRHKVEVVDATGKTLTYNSDIQIVEANSINEAGVIVGTAFIRKPVYKVDDKGLPVVENGKYVFELDGNGNPVTSYLPRAVVLEPSATGTACTAVDENTGGEKYERQGAATLFGLLLLPLVWLRRRVN
ncbi:DUF3466 family protein [Shewanella sp. JM162201]|uniref:DUF3466 family protein n=1 Tax=Shewanella jiangmenensis TaxID=2837387 RepID=A0ABS5V7L5_9GAMM|nr:DUF3466 family protein [Shewanella jiangmenensis]MBT1445651.1 DUF3466 family protein [Shewanella jiangmenensis]